MAGAIRTIGHEDRLSLVDHLEELRTRLIVSAAVLGGRLRRSACGRTTSLLEVINKPLHQPDEEAGAEGRRDTSVRPRWRSRAC